MEDQNDFREDEEVASSEPQGDELRSSPAETNGSEITESCERQNQDTAAGDCVSKPELAEVTDESVGGVAQGAGGESEGEKGVGSGDGAVCEDVLGVCGEGEGEREGVGEGEGGVEPGKEGAVRIVEEGEEQLSQKSSTAGSIYLDDGSTSQPPPPPSRPRRLTRAERARQEALATFGGTDLASVTVKKRDLREELHRDAQLMAQGEDCGHRVKRKTRLQAAREDSSAAFKDVLFGGRETRKRQLESKDETDAGSNPPKVARRMTKAERAKQDVLKSFGGCGFDDVMATSRKRMARTFELKPDKEGGEGEGEGGGDEKEKENMESVSVET